MTSKVNFGRETVQVTNLIVVPDIKLIPIEIFPSNSPVLEGGVLEETATYEEGNVSSGYGRSSGVSIEIGKDITIDLNVDINLKTISEEKFEEWKKEAYTFFSEEQKQFLDERWGGSGRAAGFFGACFGFAMRGNAYHYKDQVNETYRATSDLQKGFAKSVYNLEATDFHVTGNVKATGTSRIPSKVKIFFQLTTITFADNKKLTVIDTDNPVAADAETGDTQRVVTQAGSKLKILPIAP
ncbi:MAG: hypothetical protein WBA43_13650 [Elainellaceae cyanobacterium]